MWKSSVHNCFITHTHWWMYAQQCGCKSSGWHVFLFSCRPLYPNMWCL